MRKNHLALLMSGLALVVMPASASGDDWPLYGHDIANSRDGGSVGPTAAEAATLTPAWDFQAPSTAGDFTGTPVVADGIAVAGSSKGVVFAVNVSDGSLRWSHDLNPGRDPKVTINGSAAIGEGRVYVPLADVDGPRIVAMDLESGALRWDRVVDSQKDADTFGSPLVDHGMVYMGTSGEFGEVNDPDVHVRGSVVALDAKHGQLRWKTFTVPPGDDGGAVWSTPAIDPKLGRLYVGTGNAYHAPAADTTDAILALDLRHGAILGHFQATPGDVWDETTNAASGPDYDFGASPNLFAGPGGQALVGEGQKAGTYWALDRQTLHPVWDVFTAPGSFLGGILGSTASDGQRIYGPDTVGHEVWSLDTGGKLDWVSAEGAPLGFNSLSVANGVVYTTDLSGVLTAHDATTGVLLSKAPLGWGAFGGVAVVGKTVVADTGTTGGPGDTGGQGHIVAFRPAAVPPAASSAVDSVLGAAGAVQKTATGG
jgi:polyvinyl alcohol dehydrogenase (cytochrome)